MNEKIIYLTKTFNIHNLKKFFKKLFNRKNVKIERVDTIHNPYKFELGERFLADIEPKIDLKDYLDAVDSMLHYGRKE